MTPETLPRYRALLEVSEAIASQRDLNALFHGLTQRLHGLVHFDYFNLVLHDPVRNRMRLHVLESAQPVPVDPTLEFTVEESPAGSDAKSGAAQGVVMME